MVSTQFDPVSRTDNYKRVMKPMLERRRRARINKCLDELREILVTALQNDGEGITRLEKADILELTVNHVRKLSERKKLAIPSVSDKVVEQQENVGKYHEGFSTAMHSVQQFLFNTKSLNNDAHKKLYEHLQKFRAPVNLSSPPNLAISSPTSVPVIHKPVPIPILPRTSPNTPSFPPNNQAYSSQRISRQVEPTIYISKSVARKFVPSPRNQPYIIPGRNSSPSSVSPVIPVHPKHNNPDHFQITTNSPKPSLYPLYAVTPSVSRVEIGNRPTPPETPFIDVVSTCNDETLPQSAQIVKPQLQFPLLQQKDAQISKKYTNLTSSVSNINKRNYRYNLNHSSSNSENVMPIPQDLSIKKENPVDLSSWRPW